MHHEERIFRDVSMPLCATGSDERGRAHCLAFDNAFYDATLLRALNEIVDCEHLNNRAAARVYMNCDCLLFVLVHEVEDLLSELIGHISIDRPCKEKPAFI
jgi:hypothetical protein